MHRFCLIAMLALLASPPSPGLVRAQDAEYTAVTTADPEVPVEDLRLLLKPLRKQELVVETEAWLDLLQEKARQISLAEIKMRQQGREISETKQDMKEKIEQVEEAEKAAKASASEAPAVAPEVVEAVADVNEEVGEQIQRIDEETEKIADAAEEVAEAVVADVNTPDDEPDRSSEKDLLAKAEEVEQAKARLKETAAEVSGEDVAVTEKVKKLGEAQIELQTKVKAELLATINKLREEQTALVDRVRVAIDALRAKGGEVEEYEKYAAAVAGLEVDVKDISATRAMIVGWLKSPEGGVRWAKTILSFLAILLASLIAASILSRLTGKAVAMNRKSSDLFKDFLVNIVHKTVLVIGVVVALSMLGINVGPLIAGIGALGFIIGFALQGTLGNFAAGMMILLHRPYDVGDVIDVAGIMGFVQSMNLNTTTIRTFDNQIVVVPNGSIWGNNITNVTGSDTRRVDMTFGISYSDDLAKAQRILESIVEAHPLVLKDPAPMIKLHELGDSSVNFICRPWTRTVDYWTVYWDVMRSVKERFDAEGVSIPFPQRDVHVYQAAVEASAAARGLNVSPEVKPAVRTDRSLT